MENKTTTPTERELEILKILWELGTASVRDVFDIMHAKEDIAQNTVQTFLRMMEHKGLVSDRNWRSSRSSGSSAPPPSATSSTSCTRRKTSRKTPSRPSSA